MFLYDEWRAEICWKKREIGGARLSAAIDTLGMEGQTAKTVEYSDGGAVNKTMNKM